MVLSARLLYTWSDLQKPADGLSISLGKEISGRMMAKKKMAVSSDKAEKDAKRKARAKELKKLRKARGKKAQIVLMGRWRIGADFHVLIRILKGFLFLGFLSVVIFVVCGLTISDTFASLIAFMPAGWALLLIGQVCRPCLKDMRFGLWDSVLELGRGYDYKMGLLIFMPIVIPSGFPFGSEFQTHLLFNQSFQQEVSRY